MKHDLRDALTGGVYLNFLEGEKSLERTRDSYKQTNYIKLLAIKATYDPDNYLRYSFAIPPIVEKAVQKYDALTSIAYSDVESGNEIKPHTI